MDKVFFFSQNHLNVHDLTFVTEKELQLDDEKAMVSYCLMFQ